MARLTLISVLTFTLAVCWPHFVQFGVNAESLAETDLDARFAEEDDADRSASAKAHAQATAQGGGSGRPGPHPGPPGPPRVVVKPSKPVDCYACSGCPDAKNATTKPCPYSHDQSKNGKCVVYSEKYYHMKKPWVVRGCASERGTCADIKEALSYQNELVQVLACAECEGDKCNGAGLSSLDLMTALTAMFIAPLLMKYTLS